MEKAREARFSERSYSKLRVIEGEIEIEKEKEREREGERGR